MNLEQGHIYHIYNQGNNRGRVFFQDRNYYYFKEKIKTHILPFGDILAWCLMPNHFHLMVYVKQVSLLAGTDGVTQRLSLRAETIGVTQSHSDNKGARTLSLNDSIGIMLRSYARAINKQEKGSEAIFREKTKSICLTKIDQLNKPWYVQDGITTFKNASLNYPKSCFRYIHNNPVKAGLVKNIADWQFSSFREYSGLEKDSLVNLKLSKDWNLLG